MSSLEHNPHRGLGTARGAIGLGLALALGLGLAGCSVPAIQPGDPTPTSAGSSGPVTAVPGLDPSALAVMNQPGYARAQWAISVRDLDTGEQLVALNPDTLVQPGSVVKTYSVGAAWQKFGPDHTITTPVRRTGEVKGGRLTGDLVLVGAGDLTMGGRTKPDGTVDYTDLDHNDANALPGATLTPEDPLTGLNDLARQVRKSGVTRVSGDVLVDDRLWDAHALENGPVTPIIINNNLIDLTSTAGEVGATATVAMRPKVSPWQVSSQVKTVAAGAKTQIAVSSPSHGKIVLTGTIAEDSGPVLNTYAFDDPATFARTAFIEALQRAGVRVDANKIIANPEGRLPARAAVAKLPQVAKLTSLPLSQEARYVLKISYNLGAETQICLLAAAAGSTDCADGLREAREIWTEAGLDPSNAVLIDGSGLPGCLITPDSQTALQTIMAERPDAALWQSTLPVLGVDGSLAMVQKSSPAAGKVFAKTGSLGAYDPFNDRFLLPAKALGGYIDAASGRRLAFMIVVSNALYPDISGVFAANDDVGKVAAILQQQY